MNKNNVSQKGKGKKNVNSAIRKGDGAKIVTDSKKGICVCFSEKAIEKLNAYADDEDMSRSAALRKLLKPLLGK